MNRYFRLMYCLPCGILKVGFTKLFHFKKFTASVYSIISPLTEISIDRGGELHIGSKFRMRDGAKIRVRTGAICIIGKNTSLNSNNMLACREKITIGDNVQFSPNVQIYDHDHDFRIDGGISEMKYKTSPVQIGNNVWIGSNTVILRGTKIGDNCVIAAGSIVKGVIPDDSIYVQKRTSEIIQIYR